MLAIASYIALYALASFAILAVTCYVISEHKRIAYVLRNGSSYGLRQRDYLNTHAYRRPRTDRYVVRVAKR